MGDGHLPCSFLLSFLWCGRPPLRSPSGTVRLRPGVKHVFSERGLAGKFERKRCVESAKDRRPHGRTAKRNNNTKIYIYQSIFLF